MCQFYATQEAFHFIAAVGEGGGLSFWCRGSLCRWVHEGPNLAEATEPPFGHG